MEKPEKNTPLGVSTEIYIILQMIASARELVTDKYFPGSVAKIIESSKGMHQITDENIAQIFELSEIPEDQAKEIMEKIS